MANIQENIDTEHKKRGSPGGGGNLGHFHKTERQTASSGSTRTTQQPALTRRSEGLGWPLYAEHVASCSRGLSLGHTAQRHVKVLQAAGA